MITAQADFYIRSHGEALLAYAMNGAPLAPEHGFPVCLVVPSATGVRSPKWLAVITVQDVKGGPIPGHFPP